mmetsp:Transcript_10824/g.28944  ORF Transcript_10824/g.28944 Transcript_10824/m.28944 type:complete len:528 (-) Transcript_10824:126-1709(-)
MFEVKMVEMVNAVDPGGQKGGRLPQPANVLRVGFSTSSSTLLLGNTEENFCFDSVGMFTFNKASSKVAEPFGRDAVVAVVLNLDAASPNANTVSLFRDGVRICQPQPIPDKLKGRPLFPAVTFRNVTVHVNFGPETLAELPFKCRAVQDAAAVDCEVVTEPKPKGGAYDVLLPVGLPDEGTFEWLDLFLEKHPEYTELSERMILDWADKSGIWRTRGYGWRQCNDRPGWQFGVPSLDDSSIKSTLYSIASLQKRHYVVMEVRGNLLKEEREKVLKAFAAPHLRVSAAVLMGEPTKDFKDRMQTLILQDKQETEDAEWKVKQQEQISKKRMEKAAKLAEREQRKAKKARTEAEAPAAKEGEEEKKPEAAPMEVEEGPDAEEKELDTQIEELIAATPPKATLTEEEKKLFFRKPKNPDLSPMLLSTSFASFTIPDKEEGLAEVKYEWYKAAKASSFLKEWVSSKKLTVRVEDLQPGEWFAKQWSSWQTQVQQWHAARAEYAKKRQAKAAKVMSPPSAEAKAWTSLSGGA